MEKYKQLIKEYSAKNYRQMTRKPEGLLKYPYLVPGSQSYSNCLWDWDSWLTDIAVRQIMKNENCVDEWFAECEKGCILNFLERTAQDGHMPIVIAPDNETPKEDDGIVNIHKPCLAQHTLFVIRENGEDVSWLKEHFHKMESYLNYYKEHMYHEKTGLYFWLSDDRVGVDNDPSIFYRPEGSCASIYLNCMMYQELLAMHQICQKMEIHGSFYEKEAESLKEAIQTHLWDERNGMFYSADLNLKPIDRNQYLHSGMPRHWDCVIERIDSWSGFMAMWAGIATKEQADRMVYENMLEKRLFYADYGICTLAKTEKMYCVVKSGNPSCWLGPIWGISNYFCYRGLKKYGFEKEAAELAKKTIRLFGQDLEKSGEFHEYYHPDTGEGVNNPGFQNWNLLVNNMIAELDGDPAVSEG